MSSSSNLTAKYDQERSRANEQSQLVYLQGQIDELRRLLKDQSNKYQWAIEQTRKTESAVAQIEGMLERHREEIAQTVERSRRDIIELRKDVANAMVKLDEGVKPIREMQAQIQQLADARRQDRDQVFPWFARIEDLEEKAQGLLSQIKEGEDRQRQLAMQLDRLRDADAAAMQEVRRLSEDFQVEKQSVRRQVVEVNQLVDGIGEGIKDYEARLVRQDDFAQTLQLQIEVLPGQITAVDERINGIETETGRIETAASDWFMLNQERLEDLRQQTNERMSELYDTDERHLQQLTAWLERLDSWLSEIEQRLGRGITRLETAHQSQLSRVTELEHRERQVINALAAAFQQQAETVTSEQTRTLGAASEM